MARDGYGIEPQWLKPEGLAAQTGWPVTRALDLLNEMVERGMAVEKDGLYRITALGLAVGEKMGVTIEFTGLTNNSRLAKKND